MANPHRFPKGCHIVCIRQGTIVAERKTTQPRKLSLDLWYFAHGGRAEDKDVLAIRPRGKLKWTVHKLRTYIWPREEWQFLGRFRDKDAACMTAALMAHD